MLLLSKLVGGEVAGPDAHGIGHKPFCLTFGIVTLVGAVAVLIPMVRW